MRKAAENAYNAATKALKRCRKHPAHQLLESFRAKDKLHGRFGCLQVPLAFLAFIVMVITPLSWWMSALLAFGLLVVMVILRAIAGRFIVSGAAAAFKKKFPEGSDDYVDAYRLFSAAKDWEENEGSDIPLVLEQLTPVETSVPSESSAPEQPECRGFFYQDNNDDRILYKLPLSTLQKKVFEAIVEDGLDPLDEETYWKQHYRYIITHTPQGYIAWHGKSYWLYVSFHDSDQQQENCVQMIEFSPGMMRHKRIDCSHQKYFEGALENLVSTPWLWLLDGVGQARQRPVTQRERDIIGENIGWTDEVHTRMGEEFPLFKEGEAEDE